MAAREGYSVEWDGMPHALACLAALDERAGVQLDDALGDAADAVAQRTRMAIPLGPVAGGHAQGSVRVDRDRLDATVSEGGPRFPYLPWLEFGGNVGRRHAVHRQWIPGGRTCSGRSRRSGRAWSRRCTRRPARRPVSPGGTPMGEF
jgi:hypothetical protein